MMPHAAPHQGTVDEQNHDVRSVPHHYSISLSFGEPCDSRSSGPYHAVGRSRLCKERLRMPLPFDATLKDLVKNHLADWLAVLGESAADPIQVLTPDLSTVSAFADIVLRLGEHLLHIDFQSGADARLPRRVLMYNT